MKIILKTLLLFILLTATSCSKLFNLKKEKKEMEHEIETDMQSDYVQSLFQNNVSMAPN